MSLLMFGFIVMVQPNERTNLTEAYIYCLFLLYINPVPSFDNTLSAGLKTLG